MCIFRTILSFILMHAALFAQIEPRTVLVLYLQSEEPEPNLNPNQAENYIEMPLNQLGLKIALFDLEKGTPNYEAYDDLRGIFAWLQNTATIKDPVAFLDTLKEQIQKGIKFVTFGSLSFDQSDPQLVPILSEKVAEIYKLIGLEDTGRAMEKDFRTTIASLDKKMVGFEYPLKAFTAPYDVMLPVKGTSYLDVHIPDVEGSRSSVVFTSPLGGYVASGWELYTDESGKRDTVQWLLNPFLFFKAAYSTENLPKPDPTTLSGRRVFYSQIDGDGFYNVSLISPYYEQFKLSPEVLLQEIFIPYSDFPFAFAPIAAEIDKTWIATDTGIDLVKRILERPNIEIGSHTLSHPFFWEFFEHYTEAEELPYLSHYPYGSWLDIKKASRLWSLRLFKDKANDPNLDVGGEYGPKEFVIPRAYANYPFNLKDEMMGSVERINKIVAPPDKTCDIYQWSGNALPFEAALALVREGGVANINGGDTRFDTTFPSYSWVAPLGRLVGQERQIYASASNENTYTDLWTDKYFAYRQVLETYWNTNVPIRVKPVDLYFHCYSGERLGSLGALKTILDDLRTMNPCCVKTSHYSKMAEGFYSTVFEKLGEKKWKVLNRGELQTIRFDQSSDMAVNWETSLGVIGQRHFQGSLYVALEPTEHEATIELASLGNVASSPVVAPRPYLLESRSPVSNFQVVGNQFSVETDGFGPLEISFVVPDVGKYEVYLDNARQVVETSQHLLTIHAPKLPKEVKCQKL